MDTPSKLDINNLRINGERLWSSLMELAQIGATPKGGVCRLTLTDLDKQGRDLVTRWAREAGMTVTIDKIGNGFMRRPGRNNSLPPIMTGSHIDTQPTGGKFDGNYGVLAGIEVVRTLNDHGIETEAPIEVAFWTNEEGSRFVPVMMGSGVFAKAFTLEHAYAATDTEGKTVKGENGLYATACFDKHTKSYIVKIANTSNEEKEITVTFNGLKMLNAGKVTVLHADDIQAENKIDHKNAVVPVTSDVQANENVLNVKMKANSFAVYRF